MDMRVPIIQKLNEVLVSVEDICEMISRRCEEYSDTIVPGFTHGQIAQPITMGWYLGAFASMLGRDHERLLQTKVRGSCDVYGVENSPENSIEICDFVADTLYSLSLLAIHISRFCEDMFVWFGEPYNMIELPDSLAAGSSMMPNKRNPDSIELLRSSSARVSGALQQCLISLKGLRMGDNGIHKVLKDLVLSELKVMLKVLALFLEIVEGFGVNKKRCIELAGMNNSGATEAAEKLAQKHGWTLRDAHKHIGENLRKQEVK